MDGFLALAVGVWVVEFTVQTDMQVAAAGRTIVPEKNLFLGYFLLAEGAVHL